MRFTPGAVCMVFSMDERRIIMRPFAMHSGPMHWRGFGSKTVGYLCWHSYYPQFCPFKRHARCSLGDLTHGHVLIVAIIWAFRSGLQAGLINMNSVIIPVTCFFKQNVPFQRNFQVSLWLLMLWKVNRPSKRFGPMRRVALAGKNQGRKEVEADTTADKLLREWMPRNMGLSTGGC